MLFLFYWTNRRFRDKLPAHLLELRDCLPAYRFTFFVETPLKPDRDYSFKHHGNTVTFLAAKAQRKDGIEVQACGEGRNWVEAKNAVIDAVIGPVLDIVAFHRKATLMLVHETGVLKAEEGSRTRHAIILEWRSFPTPTHLTPEMLNEINAVLELPDEQLPHPALRWLRYAYRPVPAMDRFVFNWMAFENMAGNRLREVKCKCGETVSKYPVFDQDMGYRILKASEPELQRKDFERDFRNWSHELRSAVLHGGKEPRTTLRVQMNDVVRRTMTAMEEFVQQTTQFRWKQMGANAIGFGQEVLTYHFIEFETSDPEQRFAIDAPTPERFRAAMRDQFPPIRLLNFDESANW